MASLISQLVLNRVKQGLTQREIANRMEELVNNGPIIRPAYKPIFHPRAYVKLSDRK